MIRLLSILFLVLATISCLKKTDPTPDGSIWRYGLPEENQMSKESLDWIDNNILSEQYGAIEGLIIIKNDQLIYEKYFNNSIAGGRGTLLKMNLGSLLYTWAAVGMCIKKGHLSINDPIEQYLPTYSDLFEQNPTLGAITIHHLLTFTSGIAWNEGNPPISSLDNSFLQMKSTNDWIQFVLEQPTQTNPGLFFTVNSANGILLAKIVENITEMSFEDFIQTSLLDPLKINEFEITRDNAGNPNGADGISSTLFSWSKLGYLALKGGLFNNVHLIDETFVESSLAIQRRVSTSHHVGYLWSHFGSVYDDYFSVDYTTIRLINAADGNLLLILPEKNMLVGVSASHGIYRFHTPSIELFRDITFAISE